MKKRKPNGSVPGAIVYTGPSKSEAVEAGLFVYSPDSFNEKPCKVEEFHVPEKGSGIHWYNISGVHDVSIIEKVGSIFNVHPLILEDIANVSQRPKFEDYERCIYVVVKMLSIGETGAIETEQVSFVLGDGILISFQQRKGDVFEAVRNRIRNNKGRIRKMGADYLLYALTDAIVDQYFSILEVVGERIEKGEKVVMKYPDTEQLHEIHRIKRDIVFLRKSVWPLREAIGALERGESELISKETAVFVRDLYDHCFQVIDAVESMRDVASGLFDLYLSSISNRMNEVMKVLTIIATIFIPITFIAGVYGMNFEAMPELKWKWSYPVALGTMLAVAGGMLLYFRKKHWI